MTAAVPFELSSQPYTYKSSVAGPDLWMREDAYDRVLELGIRQVSSLVDLVDFLQRRILFADGTSSSAHVISLEPAICRELSGNELLYEVKRLSGLSWELIAQLVGVSRRSVHNWASGENINLEHNQRLGRILTTMRFIDNGDTERNTALLMSPANNSSTYFELMKAGHYDEVKSLAGKGSGRPVPRSTPRESVFSALGMSSFAEELDSLTTDDMSPGSDVSRKPKLRKAKARRR